MVDASRIEHQRSVGPSLIGLLLGVQQAGDQFLGPCLKMLFVGIDQLTQYLGTAQHMKDGEAELAGPAVLHDVSLEPGRASKPSTGAALKSSLQFVQASGA